MLSETQLEVLKNVCKQRQFDKIVKLVDDEIIHAIDSHSKSLNLLCTTSEQMSLFGELTKKSPESLRTRETERRLKALIADKLRTVYTDGSKKSTTEEETGGSDSERTDQVLDG